MYYSQGKYGEADALYMSAVKITKRSLGPDHPQLAAIMSEQADLYRRDVRIYLYGISAVFSVQTQIGKRHVYDRPSCIVLRVTTEKRMRCT